MPNVSMLFVLIPRKTKDKFVCKGDLKGGLGERPETANASI